ncbi:MAG TPA: MBL fold metallo-hydrolase [Candidatus Polarisedimenticolaceae bacterium]|nr:MBL fold metallo-hydrolase [Candidatus Polarisedimenticolaceae bacterium]
MATLQFLGATGTVTGSKYLLEHDGFRMLVDCGLFQGLKELRLRNWSPPPFEPSSLGLILLTHAHLDHSGYLPVVYRGGYEGATLTTPASRDLCGIILPDSGHLQEEDARFANRHGFTKHKPALPLYTQDDARRMLPKIDTIAFDTPREVHPGITVNFKAAGHIVGASMIEVRISKNGKTTTVLFSGDLGRPDQPILPDPEPLVPCDHLLCESTYGNRDHPKDDPKQRLGAIVNETIRAGGSLLIPSFAVGRTQHLMYLLRQLRAEGTVPEDVPIWVDSPMAIAANTILVRHPEAQDDEMRAAEARGADVLGMKNVHFATTIEQSKGLNNVAYPTIIISASGMAEGGRILHHLAYKVSDHRTTVLLVGFQAVGTRGRALQDGAKFLKMFGREIPVKARVETLDGLSAHADRGEILAWLGKGGVRPGRVHLVHGEPDARDALAAQIRATLKLDVHCPSYLEKVDL